LNPGQSPGAALDPAVLLRQRGALHAAPQTIHLWNYRLRAPQASVAHCLRLLSPGERQRAGRFRFAADRDAYVVAHGVLRSVLGRYCGAQPDALQFDLGPAGKPRLRPPGGNAPVVSFNLSHCADRALLAVGDGRELGVDLEQVREDSELLAIAGRSFCASEHESIEAGAPGQRMERFFRYWVAKESVLKAEGIGIGFPLDRFEVRFGPGGAIADVRSHAPAQLGPHWTVRLAPVEPGWVAAVCAGADRWSLQLESAAVTE
jgi:4'-phosphopantetheinyl transferase